jgi:hypothetical protein
MRFDFSTVFPFRIAAFGLIARTFAILDQSSGGPYVPDLAVSRHFFRSLTARLIPGIVDRPHVPQDFNPMVAAVQPS